MTLRCTVAERGAWRVGCSRCGGLVWPLTRTLQVHPLTAPFMSSPAAPTAAAATAAPVADSNAAPAVAGAAAASSSSTPQAGFKSCSGCARSLHGSAYSATQAKAPAKSRKCMECVINAGKAAEIATAAAAAAAAASASASTSAPTAAAAKKKSKASTPGSSIAQRERGAA